MSTVVKEFKSILKDYEQDEDTRDTIIKISRNILRPSKQAIHAIHRDDIQEAKTLLKEAEKTIKEVKKLQNKSKLKDVGAYEAGLEEYAEAKSYLHYIEKKEIISQKDIATDVHYTIYLKALSDLSGELARRAVIKATEKEYDEVKEIYTVLDELLQQFMLFDFRAADLRKKLEAVKYSVNKVQQIFYDIEMKR